MVSIEIKRESVDIFVKIFFWKIKIERILEFFIRRKKRDKNGRRRKDGKSRVSGRILYALVKSVSLRKVKIFYDDISLSDPSFYEVLSFLSLFPCDLRKGKEFGIFIIFKFRIIRFIRFIYA